MAQQDPKVEPITIEGGDTPVTVPWGWLYAVEMAFDVAAQKVEDRDTMRLMISMSHAVAGRMAMARKDDPNLSDYYREFLPETEQV